MVISMRGYSHATSLSLSLSLLFHSTYTFIEAVFMGTVDEEELFIADGWGVDTGGVD